MPQPPVEPGRGTELPDWLADPALAPVWAALHGPVSRDARTVRLRGLSRETRHALSFLLGKPVVGDLTLPLADVIAVLRVRGGPPLAEVVVAATGQPLAGPKPPPPRKSPAMVRLSQADPRWVPAIVGLPLMSVEVVEAALAVLDALRAGPRLRTELAANVLGDARALDEASPIGTLLVRILAIQQGLSPNAHPYDRRGIWQRGGVLPDSVSSTVLTLGLRPLSSCARGDRFRAAAALGDPVHLSTWDLARTPMALDPAVPVLVCENEAVLEAFAMRHGGAYPVVCSSIWPTAVAMELLSSLGAPLAYHGDLDWRGVDLCSHLTSRCGVVPWRMGAADYLTAPGSKALTGKAVETPWDPGLAEAMRERGVVVHEEQVLETLLTTWTPEAGVAHIARVHAEEQRRVEAQVVGRGRFRAED